MTSFSFIQAIVYEGQDKNPEMCRVLLTHEVMCRWVSMFLPLHKFTRRTILPKTNSNPIWATPSRVQQPSKQYKHYSNPLEPSEASNGFGGDSAITLPIWLPYMLCRLVALMLGVPIFVIFLMFHRDIDYAGAGQADRRTGKNQWGCHFQLLFLVSFPIF